MSEWNKWMDGYEPPQDVDDVPREYDEEDWYDAQMEKADALYKQRRLGCE